MNNSGTKIAIFDDDEDILAICTFILEDNGWEVSTFSDCIDPVEKLTPLHPNVIIMDNWIPETGGIEATHALKKSPLAQIPVIYFSANADVKQLAETAGADAYLAKPFDVIDLIGVLEQVLRSRS